MMFEIMVIVGGVLVVSIAAAAVPYIRRMRRETLGTAVVANGEPFQITVHAPGRRLWLDVSFTVEATGRRADEGTLVLEISPATGVTGSRFERTLGSTNDSASHTSDAGGYLRASTSFAIGISGVSATVVAGTLRILEDGFTGTFFITLTCDRRPASG